MLHKHYISDLYLNNEITSSITILINNYEILKEELNQLYIKNGNLKKNLKKICLQNDFINKEFNKIYIENKKLKQYMYFNYKIIILILFLNYIFQNIYLYNKDQN